MWHIKILVVKQNKRYMMTVRSIFRLILFVTLMTNFLSSALTCRKCTLPGVECTNKDLKTGKFKIPGEKSECSGSCYTQYINGDCMI